ncbi:hypothetical protein [Streptomyces sp. NBC_01465]|uniref:hypothetical protein n=1 Tax=Streptomyces sp. NBC_01465 TaxID=2903878 RepID=UPI002E35CDE2|nr:hypothetical protein [Streptomyces sp. NBC_01465]
MDKWQEGAQFGHMYEPPDVTVQRDGLGRELAESSVEETLESVVGESPDAGPVFVDASGRRGRKIRRLGWLAGIVCACYAVMLVATVLGGNSSAPWLLIPGPSDDGKKAADTVRIPPNADASQGAVAAPGQTSGTYGAASTPGAATPTGTAAASPAASGKAGAGATAPAKPGQQPTAKGSPDVAGPLPGGSQSSAPAASPSASASPDPGPSASSSPPPVESSPPAPPAAGAP